MREAQRVLGNRPDAEDATQEAMLRIWRHGTSNPPRAWLSAVIRNEALRLLERRQRLPIPTEPASMDSSTGHHWEDASVSAMTVSQLLAQLPPDDRVLLQMRYLEDLTQPEMARRLGMPEGTVKVRLHRLRAQLRETTEGDLL